MSQNEQSSFKNRSYSPRAHYADIAHAPLGRAVVVYNNLMEFYRSPLYFVPLLLKWVIKQKDWLHCMYSYAWTLFAGRNNPGLYVSEDRRFCYIMIFVSNIKSRIYMALFAYSKLKHTLHILSMYPVLITTLEIKTVVFSPNGSWKRWLKQQLKQRLKEMATM